ncbi:MAG: HAD-IA family hydrolase [Bryobacteraceae bacterium]|nr:HAD-IA family hydrolase [Bryobacteraceae bacterium]
MDKITTLLFDVGGVLLTNGWDRERRNRAVEKFRLDPVEFDRRHRVVDRDLEVGRITLDEYLAWTVFHQPRSFTLEEFRAFLCEQSEAHLPVIEFTRRLSGHYRLAALNNESAELNQYRITRFGLREIIPVFLSSCYLGARKPEIVFYENALRILQRSPEECVFIDDRAENLDPARLLGLNGIHFRGLDALRDELTSYGVSIP